MGVCNYCEECFDEIDLTWVPRRGTLILLCEKCDDNCEREREDSSKELGARNMDGQQREGKLLWKDSRNIPR